MDYSVNLNHSKRDYRVDFKGLKRTNRGEIGCNGNHIIIIETSTIGPN